VDFARELWFVIQHAPSLAHRYQAHALWAGVFLVLSMASMVAKTLVIAPVREMLLKRISAVSSVVTATIFVLAFIDLAKTRLPFDDLVCESVAVDAYYHPPADRSYDLVERYRCSNRTSQPVRNLRAFQDGYYERIPTWSFTSKLLSPATVQLNLIRRSSEPDQRASNFQGGGDTLYVYGATMEFQPSLPSGEAFDLVYRMSAQGAPVEGAAFTNKGTVFARGVEYGTLDYYVTIHAPVGYAIQLRGWQVVDPDGHPIPDETNRQRRPTVTAGGNLLQWRVSLARRHLRYTLQYAFTPYELA
jgi:hypothetical protein